MKDVHIRCFCVISVCPPPFCLSSSLVVRRSERDETRVGQCLVHVEFSSRLPRGTFQRCFKNLHSKKSLVLHDEPEITAFLKSTTPSSPHTFVYMIFLFGMCIVSRHKKYPKPSDQNTHQKDPSKETWHAMLKIRKETRKKLWARAQAKVSKVSILKIKCECPRALLFLMWVDGGAIV